MAGSLPGNYLDPIVWGTSAGGAASASETTSTIGQDPLDYRVPPDQYHLSNLQIARIRQLCAAMSTTFKGGTRLGLLTQTANPFSASESGIYMDTSGVAYKVFNGTATSLVAGGGSGDMILASVQTNTGAKTFNASSLLVNNAGNTFASTMASAATAARTWTLPDATDTAVGRAGATMTGAFTFTGTQLGTYSLGGTPSLGATLLTAGNPLSDTVSVTLKSTAADGASAVAAKVDTTTAWSNASARLLSLGTNGVEKVYVLANGNIQMPYAAIINGDTLSITGGTNAVHIGGSTANGIAVSDSNIDPSNDNVMGIGGLGNRYFKWLYTQWVSTRLGAQLTAASTITPTVGLHHVTGGTTIDTIAVTNLPSPGGNTANATLTILADGGTITWSALGNIMTAGTVAQNKAQVFQYDATAVKWYAVQ